MADTANSPSSVPLVSDNEDQSSCSISQRVRKEWRQLTRAERELLVSTIEQSIEKNLLQTFWDYHSDPRSSFQAHATCGFALWHRRYLLAAEDMLRNIDPPRTSCLTVPYWDISMDFERQQKGECFSFASCAPGLFHDMMGGVPGLFQDLGDDMVNATRQFGAIYTSTGVLVNGRPVANLKDDLNHLGIVRDDLFRVPIPSSAGRHEISSLILENSAFDPFTHKMQESIHDDVHISIGGFMPTFSSPTDVFFWVWHSTIDLIYNLWQECHHTEPIFATKEFMGNENCDVRPLWSDSDFLEGGPPPLEYPPGMNLQPSSNEEMVIGKQLNSTSRLDARDDPVIGEYFVVDRQFWKVADSRTMSAENSFTFDLLNNDLAMWNTDSLKSFCEYHREDDGAFQLTSLSTARNDAGVDLFYPYSGLERIVKDSILDLFPPNDPLSEDSSVQRKRLQYVSCAIFYSRGTIVSDPHKWERFLTDVIERAAELPEGGPDRCSFLWPGAWIPPSTNTPSTPADDEPRNPNENNTAGGPPPPFSHSDSIPSMGRNNSSMDHSLSGGLRHKIFHVALTSCALLFLLLRKL